jgi:molecular chaperone GrpE
VSGPKRDDEPRFGGAEEEAFVGATEGSPPAPPAEPDAASSDEPAVDAEQDTDELARAQAQAKEYLDHLRRLQAEFDNYRKRVLKEQTRAVELASEPVMRRLLEVVDDFELALISANDKPDFDRFLHGVELVFAKLMDTLRAEGLERIEAKGRPFDPERHEALLQTGDGEGDPTVADVLRPGYTLRGRVLRPAGVRVERK